METAKRLIDIYADIVPDFIPRLSKCMNLDAPHARLTIKNVLKHLAKDKAKKHVLIGVNRMKLKPEDHTFDELFTSIDQLKKLRDHIDQVSELLQSANP